MHTACLRLHKRGNPSLLKEKNRIMKILSSISHLFSVAAILFLVSCSVSDDEPQIDQIDLDLLSGRWSVTQEVDKWYDQSQSLVETISYAYDANMFTIEFIDASTLRFVHVYKSMWAETTYTLNESDSTLTIFNAGEDQSDVILKFTDLSQNGATMVETGTENDGGTVMQYTNTYTMSKSQDALPALSETQIVGSWTIDTFREYKNGEEITVEDSPAGATIRFNSDGTGVINMGQESVALTWVWIDNCNFSFSGAMEGPGSEPETVLLHVQSFESGTGALEVLEGSVEYIDGSQNTWESHIGLTKNS
jgi:hypothetical protein